MLRAFGHLVATFCNVLGVVGSILKLVKFAPTTPNISQHIATRWPNARNMLCPTMLRYVVLACWLGFLLHARAQSTHAITKMHASAESVLKSAYIPLTNRVRGLYRKLRTEFFPPRFMVQAGPSAKRAGHKSKGKNEDP